MPRAAKVENTLRRNNEVTTEKLQKYKLLVDSVEDYAIFLLDETGHIETWNKGAQKIKGYAPEEIIGKHFSNFYTDEDIEADKPAKELAIAIEFGRVEDEDWRVRKDGTKFWASVVITALFDEDKKLVGFAKVTRDLTERKDKEDQLRLANNLLKTQQKELTKLNQSKDDFISLASHQLRTPATAIKQILGMYVEGFYKDVAQAHLDILKKAYDANNRQISIVNSLLKVAQIDSGKVRLRPSKFDIVELMEAIKEEFLDTIRERRQTLVTNYTIKDSFITADQHNLRMALENLVSNASKYAFSQGTIELGIREVDNKIHITVSDNGVGIARADVPKLFEKFNRLQNDLTDEVDGTGLGLYWAHKIIQLHGGRIEVESRLNEGSTFTVILPRES